jgi:hypothetical protein
MPANFDQAVYICFRQNQLIFRSGYNQTPINLQVESGYDFGLAEIKLYDMYRKFLNKLSFVKSSYGQTVLTEITRNNIIKIVHGWYEYAKRNPYKK